MFFLWDVFPSPQGYCKKQSRQASLNSNDLIKSENTPYGNMGSHKEAEEEWSAIQGQFKLHKKNITSMSYIKPCLKPKVENLSVY